MTHDYFDITLREKIWLKRLVEEYDQIIRKYHVKGLKPANLRLSAGSTTLGTWSKSLRMISLSKKLLFHAPWESVIQIFKHEIAHQIADELLGGDDAHGSVFINACQMIWVEPWARSAKVEIGYSSGFEASKNRKGVVDNSDEISNSVRSFDNLESAQSHYPRFENPDLDQKNLEDSPLFSDKKSQLAYETTSAHSAEKRAEVLFWEKFKQQTVDIEGQKIRERLGKLLALSESTNPHEASIALAKAREMQQGLILTSLDGYEDFETRIVRPRKKRLERHFSQIASILSVHYNVRVIFSREFDTKELSDFQTMEIIGQRHAVELAEYVYNFLLKTLHSSFNAESKNRIVDRKSFYSGFLDGLSEKLKSTATPMPSLTTGKALLIQQNNLLEHYLGRRHPLITTRRLAGRALDGGSFEFGREKGRKLEIRSPIKSTEIKFLR